MPPEETSQFLRAIPIVTKKIQIIFRNGIAIIRVLEYNIISYTWRCNYGIYVRKRSC